jgi:branched-chain amino acid transport system ATP-binding protein
MTAMERPLFSVKGLTKYFDGIRAVDSFSFDVTEGALPVSSGRTVQGRPTVFNIVTGIYRPTCGEVLFRGENISGQRPTGS